MAPHSSTLAWKIPWMEEPGGLPSMGLLGVGHDWSDLAAAAAAGLSSCTLVGDAFVSSLRILCLVLGHQDLGVWACELDFKLHFLFGMINYHSQWTNADPSLLSRAHVLFVFS